MVLKNFFSEIQNENINTQEAFNFVNTETHGAVVSFIGTVRNNNNNKNVTGIYYDVFNTLAENIFQNIYNDIINIYKNEFKVYISHKKGLVKAGNISIVIYVSTTHRGTAFQICNFILENIKQKLPVWKKEIYINNETKWINNIKKNT